MKTIEAVKNGYPEKQLDIFTTAGLACLLKKRFIV